MFAPPLEIASLWWLLSTSGTVRPSLQATRTGRVDEYLQYSHINVQTVASVLTDVNKRINQWRQVLTNLVTRVRIPQPQASLVVECTSRYE